MRISSRLSCVSARLVYLGVTAVGALMLFPAGSAQAAPVTIGQLAPANPPAYCTLGPFESLPIPPTPGASYSVPAPGGVITSWSTNATAGAGQSLEFKIFKPIEIGHTYLVVAHDGPRAIVPSALNTFKVRIPVQADNLISLNDLNASEVPNACAFKDGTTDKEGFETGNLADGATMTVEGTEAGARPNLTATVVLTPTISSISPSTGLTTGNTSVTIKGTNFTEASAVKFGAVPASSFTVVSDTQITAVAPADATPGVVDATVTNVAGTSATSAADQFTYTPPVTCVVPKLKGKKLTPAKRALTKAECTLGKVKGKESKSAKVRTQKPKPGTVLTAGSKVNVKVG
jgi:hypothetical protein